MGELRHRASDIVPSASADTNSRADCFEQPAAKGRGAFQPKEFKDSDWKKGCNRFEAVSDGFI
tara:strand:+ start:444 stop:632 length:189 start_codon:yes stop_codon:yes gene_type:complete